MYGYNTIEALHTLAIAQINTTIELMSMGLPNCIARIQTPWSRYWHVHMYLFSDGRNGYRGLEWMLQDWCVDKLQLSIVCQHQDVWGKEMSGLTQLGDLIVSLINLPHDGTQYIANIYYKNDSSDSVCDSTYTPPLVAYLPVHRCPYQSQLEYT